MRPVPPQRSCGRLQARAEKALEAVRRREEALRQAEEALARTAAQQLADIQVSGSVGFILLVWVCFL